jgi:hypothetical protein
MARVLNPSGIMVQRKAVMTQTPEQPPEDATTIAALEEWVQGGDVSARAQIVIDLETAKPEKEQRPTLLTKMEQLKDGSDLI